ncbi:hypothetical protein niasHT_027197 [Heterodera trifolii]|uniref:Uncharacterized protein n=1 Tax=Heterodera trifolii TaxID=157864 RepID=A0ABD2KP56_9BILA
MKKAYGIEFRLPKDGGNCDQGVLICYPALLQRGTHLDTFINFKLKRTFTIENSSFNSDARAMQNDFLANIRQNGVAFLADYTALWLLGLDMLPMMHKWQQQQEMKLFISRSSNCTMEAWFLQPSVFPINFTNIREQQQMISIKALTELNFNNILVELINVKKDGSTKTEISFKIGTDTDLEVAYSPLIKIGVTGSCKNDETNYPSTSSKLLQHKGVRLPRAGIYVLKLDIVLTKHCYALKLDGILLDVPKCPSAGGQLPLDAISRLKVERERTSVETLERLNLWDRDVGQSDSEENSTEVDNSTVDNPTVQGKMSLLVEPLVQQIGHGTTALLPSAAEGFKSRFKNIDADFWMEIGNACQAGTQLIMLSMSSRDSFEKRSCARETWMKEAVYGEVRRFFVADPSDGEADNVQQELDAEQKKYGDMVFLHGFVDKYMHLHFKWHGALIWQQRHCAGAEWVAKVDDDTVVHLRRMAFWINKKFRQIATDHPLVFFGDASGRREPFRDMRIKWCISKKVFSAELFPPFVFGGCYLTNRATVQAVLAKTHKTDGFFLDDVLFTGILAGLANATISDQQRHITSSNRKLQFKCVHGVPTLFTKFNADNRAQCEEFFAYLKKMSCENNVKRKNNAKRNLISMLSSLLIAISLIYAFFPFH